MSKKTGRKEFMGYFDPARSQYIVELRDDPKTYVTFNESSCNRFLRSVGYSAEKEKDKNLSEVEAWFNTCQLVNRVGYAGKLAGYAAGEYTISDSLVIVDKGPNYIETKAGTFDTWETLIGGQLGDQLPRFLAWMKQARVPFDHPHSANDAPCPALALAGGPGCGKSLLQNLITECLGGRSAQPYSYMVGRTDFNSELFSAEHLMIEDEVAFTDIRSRREFGSRLKQVVASKNQRLHAKGREALTMTPVWRVTISLNDEPESLMVLPPLDHSISDKLLLLRVKNPGCLPEATKYGAREKFWADLMKELPHFLHYVRSYRVPKDIKCQRFGVKGWQHPDLKEVLDDMAPELRLLALIDGSKITQAGPWSGRADELETEIRKSYPSLDLSRLFTYSGACGSNLRKLMDRHPDRFSKVILNGVPKWTILGS